MPAPVRTVKVTERGQRFFPRSDLVDAFGRSLILPETHDLRVFEVRDVADGARLMTFGLIGYLPLTKTTTLNIVPKTGTRNEHSLTLRLMRSSAFGSENQTLLSSLQPKACRSALSNTKQECYVCTNFS